MTRGTLGIGMAFTIAMWGCSNDSSKDTATLIDPGLLVYQTNCQVCHGVSGEGGRERSVEVIQIVVNFIIPENIP